MLYRLGRTGDKYDKLEPMEFCGYEGMGHLGVFAGQIGDGPFGKRVGHSSVLSQRPRVQAPSAGRRRTATCTAT